jgi:hypothetical protein
VSHSFCALQVEHGHVVKILIKLSVTLRRALIHELSALRHLRDIEIFASGLPGRLGALRSNVSLRQIHLSNNEIDGTLEPIKNCTHLLVLKVLG